MPMQALTNTMPPGAPPVAAPPAAGPPGMAAGMIPPELMMFLAGAGFEQFAKSLKKLLGAGGGSEGQPHRAGMRVEAAQAPGTTIAPQMLQQIAAQQSQAQGAGAQPPPGVDALRMIVARLIGGG